jgi:hypothetical protein
MSTNKDHGNCREGTGRWHKETYVIGVTFYLGAKDWWYGYVLLIKFSELYTHDSCSFL